MQRRIGLYAGIITLLGLLAFLMIYLDIKRKTPQGKKNDILNASNVKIEMSNLGYHTIDIPDKHKAAYIYDMMQTAPGKNRYGITYKFGSDNIWFYYEPGTKKLTKTMDGNPIVIFTWYMVEKDDIKDAIQTGYFGVSKKETISW